MLTITGHSNVNTFICQTKNYSACDTLEYKMNEETYAVYLVKNKMTTPVDDFDCGNSLMTKDFLETLDHEKHPLLSIQFLSLQGIENTASSPVFGKVKIHLAGEAKDYSITFTVTHATEGTISLSGTQTLKFSDFKLTPPRKMMGLVQVKEKLEVNFLINLRPL